MKRLLLLTLIGGAYINAQNITTGTPAYNTAQEKEYLSQVSKAWQEVPQSQQKFGSNVERLKYNIKNAINHALEEVKVILNNDKSEISAEQISGLMNSLRSFARSTPTTPSFGRINLQGTAAQIYSKIRSIVRMIAQSGRATGAGPHIETIKVSDSNLGQFLDQLNQLINDHNTDVKQHRLLPLGKPMEEVTIEEGEMHILPIDLNK